MSCESTQESDDVIMTKSKFIGGVFFILALAATVFFKPWEKFNSHPKEAHLASRTEASFYQSQIQPIFNAKCIACHSCNTAPCQLNLTNYEGLIRGAHQKPLYLPKKMTEGPPTRIGIDAKDEAGWRALGFFSVVGKADSNLFQSLNLKMQNSNLNPEIRAEKAKTCPQNPKEWVEFSKDHLDMGMPYGLPALTSDEFQLINQWLAMGAPGPNPQELWMAKNPTTASGKVAVQQVEDFLNQGSIKSKIVSRYLYEHLFLAHLEFKNEMPGQFFRMVRSKSACKIGVDEIATRLPYSDPGQTEFHYCLKKIDQAITEKNHIVYPMSTAKLKRWNDLFFGKPWSASALPSYDSATSANPFLTFKDLPADSRYRWLLDNAEYTVMTFIKGAVCRGPTAVNVIDEQFHVLFLDPKADHFVNDADYAAKVAEQLRIPAHYGNKVKMIDISDKLVPFVRSELKQRMNTYRAMRDQKYSQDRPQGYSLNDIWDGDGHNPNAVLTVFRHYDSAQVMTGAWGGTPKTAWVLDYPLFERIVYNLVAGFDVFGNMGHQLLTRVYMHYIRMESEEHFLSFLPRDSRAPLRSYWYREAPDVNKRYPLNSGTRVLSPTSVVFSSSNEKSDGKVQGKNGNLEIPELGNKYKKEFLDQVYQVRMNSQVLGQRDLINAFPEKSRQIATINSIADFERELRKIVSQPASQLPFSNYLDDASLVRVRVDGGVNDRVYTFIRNKEHFNIASILGERGRRDFANDFLSVLPGYQASYPNRFFAVDLKNANAFLNEMQKISKQADIRNLLAQYGIDRTDPNFWQHYDWFVEHFKRTQPSTGGAIDLIRYGNSEPLPEDDENKEELDARVGSEIQTK